MLPIMRKVSACRVSGLNKLDCVWLTETFIPNFVSVPFMVAETERQTLLNRFGKRY